MVEKHIYTFYYKEILWKTYDKRIINAQYLVDYLCVLHLNVRRWKVVFEETNVLYHESLV